MPTSAAKTEIDPLHWDPLLERIHARRCVPFLGAGVNLRTSTYPGLPLGSDLALRMVERMIGIDTTTFDKLAKVQSHVNLRKSPRYHDLVRLALRDLARVALHVKQANKEQYLNGLLQELLPDEKLQPSKILKTIAELPLDLVVTTNYDRLMERAFAATTLNNNYRVVVQPMRGFDPMQFPHINDCLAEPGGVILYKLHGTFGGGAEPDHSPCQQPNAKHLIITEEDYIEFLTVAAIENIGVPNVIAGGFKRSTLLFLGYSLEDWDFRTIYKGLIERSPPEGRNKSFAIQRDPSAFWVEFWKAKDVEIYNIDLYDFAAELESKYKAYAAKSANKR